MRDHATVRAVLSPVARASALCALLFSPMAWAVDASQAKVVWGVASVQTSGATTTVNQGTGAVRIDWTGMDVPAGSTLAFNQLDKSWVAINVVTGSTPTSILGSITAPGHVYVLNPNGVLIGRGAQITVGSWVASTMALESFDLDSGALALKRDTSRASGEIKNEGTITADGGSVALIGNRVSNSGTISAAGGRAMLLGGDSVVLTPDRNGLLSYSLTRSSLATSVSNAGNIAAAGGQIVLDARSLVKAVVNSSGVLEAAGVSQGPDGVIRLVALGAAGSSVSVRGTVDAGASGEATTDLSEQGQLDFGPEVFRAHMPSDTTALGITAQDKVYDGTTDATVRINLSGMPGNASAPVTLDVQTAHFDERYSQGDDASYVWFKGQFSKGVDLTLPTSLEAYIRPRQIHLEADSKTYDGTTDATVHVLAGDVLDMDTGLITVSAAGARFSQADVSSAPIALVWDALNQPTLSGPRQIVKSYVLSTDGSNGVILPKTLNVVGQSKVADGTRQGSVVLDRSGLAARDLGPGRLDVSFSNVLFDSAGSSNTPVGITYVATPTGDAAGNYSFTGRTSAMITARPFTPIPATQPTVPEDLPVVIGNGQRGGQSATQAVNPGALSDILGTLPPPAAGEGEGKSAEASGSDRDSAIRVIDGGIKLPALLTIR